MLRSQNPLLFIRFLVAVGVGGSLIDYLPARDSVSNDVELVAIGTISGTASDQSEATGQLEEGTPTNQIGGFSAIEYSGRDDRYWVLADRGPADGAASYPCRIQSIELKVDVETHILRPRVVGTVMLRDKSGKPLLGSLKDVPEARFERGIALDPEGLRVTSEGEFIVSDEYGPSLDFFAPTGDRIKSWELPKWMRLTRESNLELAKDGAMPNRGLEGLAISADQASIVAAMQGPLIQDSYSDGKKRFGNYVRLIQMPLNGEGQYRQFLYPLSHKKSGISEILAYDESRYLLLERDGEVRPDADYKAIYLAKLDSATDVASYEKVPSRDLPPNVLAVEKELFIDLLDERWAIPKKHLLEKPEGLAWGPMLRDGRRLLVVCFDNDFQSEVESLFLAFAVK